MKKEIDIYNYPERLRSALNRIEKASISSKNKQLILEFRDNCSMKGIGLPRTVRYLQILNDWAKILKKDFDKADKKDIMAAVRVIQEKERYTAWTKVTYKSMLKSFFKWLKKTSPDYPDEVKWITTTIKRNERKLPSNGDLITEEEIKKAINAAEHPRDKALVGVLYESGGRIGEIASLQIENVKFDQYGATLYVQGKTGSRPIRIIWSTPYLTTWIQSHPLKEDQKAPLWTNIGSVRHNKAMRYGAIRNIIMKDCQPAGKMSPSEHENPLCIER